MKSPLGASTRDIIWWVAALQPVLCWGAAGRDQAEVLNTRRRPDPRHFLYAYALLVPINGIRELLQVNLYYSVSIILHLYFKKKHTNSKIIMKMYDERWEIPAHYFILFHFDETPLDAAFGK